MAKRKDQADGHSAVAIGKIRDRIKEFRRVPAELLRPSRLNFRRHPEEQRAAMRAILTEIGYAGAALARELPDGSLELIDGHLRSEESSGQMVPTLILDVTAEEAATLVALYDPIGDLAKIDQAAVNIALENVQVDADPLQVVLLELSGSGQLVPKDDGGTKGGKESVPEMDLRPYEHYDYVLVLARTTMDWQALATLLGLEKIDASPTAKVKKIGLGHCIDAKVLLQKLQGIANAPAQ